MIRRIVHVDMDAFYASVEQHDGPDLRGQPVIVGGSAQGRGVVAAASYEARRYGIHSAMPTSQAMRLCPHVVRLDVRFARYREISQQVHRIFETYTSLIEPISLDESFLDVTRLCEAEHRKAGAVALEIKSRILQATGLIASAGVAPNKLVAKIASDINKPDGFLAVAPENVEAFLRPLPVRRLWGVGPVTAARLEDLGLHCIGDVADRSIEWLEENVGRAGREFHRMAHGVDDRPVVSSREPHLVSAENTFGTDIDSADDALKELSALAAEVAERLQRKQVRGRTLTLKVRYADFTTITRSATGTRCFGEPDELFETASNLLLTRTDFPQRAIRLVGLGVSGLEDGNHPLQLDLWRGNGE